MTLRVDLRNCKKSELTKDIKPFELGCMSMVIQMGKITEDTYQEFYARCKVYWTMSGSEDWYTLDQIRDLIGADINTCLLYTSPSPRDGLLSRMPSSA